MVGLGFKIKRKKVKMFSSIKEQANLTDRECQIISERLDGKTYKQLAEKYGISNTRVGQIIKRAVIKIKKAVIYANLKCTSLKQIEICALENKPFSQWTRKEIYENFNKIPNRIDKILGLVDTRLINCLFRNGIYTIEQIKDDDYFWDKVINFKNIGKKSIQLLMNKYHEYEDNQLYKNTYGCVQP